MKKPLLVRSGGLTGDRTCAIVLFWRQGSFREFPCYVALYAAHNDAYLRSLVSFMQHRIPNT